MPRVLLLATTTGYQTRSFGDAARKLGVDLTFATDRCHVLEDPWGDAAVPVRFFDEEGSVADILEASRLRPIDGVLAVGDRPTVMAARVCRALGLPGHDPDAAAAARDKQRTRERLCAAGLPGPWFQAVPLDADPRALVSAVPFPCVIKPVALSASRGVMRADDAAGFVKAFERLGALLESPEVRSERTDAHDRVLVESFIPGREYALEGILHRGALKTLALFDKPEPLDGPFFEETIYTTPSRAPKAHQEAIVAAIAQAASAMGLWHGPIHAEARVNERGVFVLEVAARPIGGLCARALRFDGPGAAPAISLEELLLRHALGEAPDPWSREHAAAGVMMIPIPARGIYRGVSGVEEACSVPGVEAVTMTAKPDQRLVPLPEGASYLGFIFGRGDKAAEVEFALRRAHACLHLIVDPELTLRQS